MRPSTSIQSTSVARAVDAAKIASDRTKAVREKAFIERPASSLECAPDMTNANTPHFSAGATAVSPALVDIGINLTHDSYDSDRDAVMARAAAAGVTQMVITGASAEGSRKAVALAHAHPEVLYATTGVHPHHATELTSELAHELEGLAHEPQVVAVGECGLDYFRDFSPRDVQRAAFARQL